MMRNKFSATDSKEISTFFELCSDVLECGFNGLILRKQESIQAAIIGTEEGRAKPYMNLIQRHFLLDWMTIHAHHNQVKMNATWILDVGSFLQQIACIQSQKRF